MKPKLDKKNIGLLLLAVVGILLIVFSGPTGTAAISGAGGPRAHTDVRFYTG